jgi:hypothetical protein
VSEPAAEAVPAPEPPPAPKGVSIAAHPRARSWIRRARARVALIAFALVLLVALHAGVPGQTAVVRALVAGIAAFLAAWAVGLVLWKQIVISELRAAYDRREARRRELIERAAAAAAAADATAQV